MHLDAFYVLLWKHIFTVELLKYKFRIVDESGQQRFLSSIAEILRKNPGKKLAVDYLKLWGEKFWIETEYRTAEFTQKLESSLEANAEIGNGIAKLGARGANKINNEEKIAVVQHGQKAVNSIQIRELAKVIELLAEDIFPPNGESYYICIDRLDEDWVGDTIRFKLLKALIETIKSFQQIRSVKIIVTFRTDLMKTLLRTIESPGFQSEKYTGYNLPIRWSRNEIAEMLNRRVEYLFEYQYSNGTVNLYDILPTHISKGVKTVDYIIDRTFFRPRDAIAFLNRCLEKAEGTTQIAPDNIKAAEYSYSDERLKAVCDEWRREYPYLRRLCEMLRGFVDGVEVGVIKSSRVEQYCLTATPEFLRYSSELSTLAENAAMDADAAGLPFLQYALQVLYTTGIVGLKVGPTTSRMFSFTDEITIDAEQITSACRIYVHKAFWVTLGVLTGEFDSRKIV